MTAAADPCLRVTWSADSGVALWCETAIKKPHSIAPAAMTLGADHGLPAGLVSWLGAKRFRHRVAVRVPLQGSWRAARVPALLLSGEHLSEIVSHISGNDARWAGPDLRFLSGVSAGLESWIRSGHVAPRMSFLDDQWLTHWDLIETPSVSLWRSECARAGSAWFSSDELSGLMAVLVDTRVRTILEPLLEERRSRVASALLESGTDLASPQLRAAVGSVAAALAHSRVEIIMRIVEPEDENEGSGHSDSVDSLSSDSENAPGSAGRLGVDALWRLNVMVRDSGGAVRSVSELPDPSAVMRPVFDTVARAQAAFPPLKEAIRSARGADLLLPPELVLDLVDRGVAILRENAIEVLVPRAWTQATTAVRLGAEPEQPAAGAKRSALGVDAITEFRWELVVDGQVLNEAEMETLIESAGELVRLHGRWVRADAAALRRATRFLTERRSRPVTVRSVVSDLLSEDAESVDVIVPDTISWLPDLADGSLSVELPPWFQATLRPYQQRGVQWLAAMASHGVGAVLADDMGLGKTMQVLALTAAEKHGGQSEGPTLVVGPLSLLRTWFRESTQWAPQLATVIHHGGSRLRGTAAIEAMKSADLVLVTYGVAVRDFEDLDAVSWHRVVVDEAQNIKNPATHHSRALRKLESRHRVALTGTPVENRLDEFRAILDYVQPGLWGSPQTFRARFSLPVESGEDPGATARFNAMSSPFVLRRVKTDPTILPDLPEKIEIRVDTALTSEQAALYRAIVDELLEEVDGKQGAKRKGAILKGLTSLKQICNHPAHYLSDGSAVFKGSAHRSGKLAALEGLIAEITEAGDKVLLFSQYRQFGDLIVPFLSKCVSRPVPFLHGGLASSARDDIVTSFQNPDGPPVLLASLKAGGTGLTLTQANHVIHIDRWWNPAVENQATDRVHRMGQTKRVQVRKLICPGTIEERIDEVLVGKTRLADDTVGSLAARATTMSDNALRDFLALTRDGALDG